MNHRSYITKHNCVARYQAKPSQRLYPPLWSLLQPIATLVARYYPSRPPPQSRSVHANVCVASRGEFVLGESPASHAIVIDWLNQDFRLIIACLAITSADVSPFDCLCKFYSVLIDLPNAIFNPWISSFSQCRCRCPL